MGWAIAILLVLIAGAGLLLLARLPRSLWELVGAALLLGLAGYAWQGHPGQPGTPRNAQAAAPRFDEDIAKLRDAFNAYGPSRQWLVLSDGLARQGRSADAANALRAGIAANPRDAALWVGLGNALVEHGGGLISPSADYSYRRAMALAPANNAAPYFYGLALARSGRFDAARNIWSELAVRLPKETPLHRQLEANLVRLDRILAGQPG